MENLKRTALFATHQRAGGKLVEFGGWEMPVQYSSIVDEHLCVRNAAGLFDIAHMGQFRARGPGAQAFLDSHLTNDVRRLSPGQGQYTLMCNSEGGVIDDLYLYRLGDEEFFLIVNASRTNADWAWLEARKGQGHGVVAPFELTNDSGRAGAVAIQGPRVVQFIDELLPGTSVGGTHGLAVSQLKKNQIGLWHWNQHEIWAARTGYTGEDGFELVASAAALEPLWERAMSLGHVGCIQPCGLGARDTLRTEMGFPLYGHELDEQTTPLDAGLGAFVALDGRSFPGHDTLAQQKQAGTSKKLAAFRMTSKAPPPRPGYSIRSEGRQLGIVVSGTQSPSLQVGIGMGYVPPPFAEVGRKIEIEIRGKEFGAEIVKRPFYRREPGVVQSPVSRPATK